MTNYDAMMAGKSLADLIALKTATDARLTEFIADDNREQAVTYRCIQAAIERAMNAQLATARPAESFMPYDGCFVPPMPPELVALWTPRSEGNWDEPEIQAPIHDFDDELELEMEPVECEDDPDDAPAQDVVATWESLQAVPSYVSRDKSAEPMEMPVLSSPWDDADVLAMLEDEFRLTCHVCGQDEMEVLALCAGCKRMVCDADSERGGLDDAVLCCRCIAAIDVMLPDAGPRA